MLLYKDWYLMRCLMAGLLVIVLLAACGGSTNDKEDNKQDATGEPMEQVSANQLVGQWMNRRGTVIEFYRDGSISGYSAGSFEAATYTLTISHDMPTLILNPAAGSEHGAMFALYEMKGCDDHAFAMVMYGARGPDLWWFVGSEDFDSVMESELRAHVWWMADIPGSELEFQSGDTVVSRYSGEEQTDTWALENNQLRAAQNDTSDEEDVASIVRVARCNGRLMTVVLNNGSDRYIFWTDPSVTPNWER
jgi:hypothetical protein